MKPRELTALGALAAILAITGVWWALALWPMPGDTPGWLLRTRAVCFGTTATGLPDTWGWMVLVGQPVSMLGTLLVLWGGAVRDGLRALRLSVAGRYALSGVTLLLVVATAAAGVRVAGASAASSFDTPISMPPPEYPRLDRPAPPLDLVDQRGARVTLSQFRGRPVIVAFAYAHCETVCPLIVRDVLEAVHLQAAARPVVVVVTLDPWRDTPARLPTIAARWKLDAGAVVVSGSVEEVEATLDAWGIHRVRDERTGEVTHPSVVYILGRDGRIAYAASGRAIAIAELIGRL